MRVIIITLLTLFSIVLIFPTLAQAGDCPADLKLQIGAPGNAVWCCQTPALSSGQSCDSGWVPYNVMGDTYCCKTAAQLGIPSSSAGGGSIPSEVCQLRYNLTSINSACAKGALVRTDEWGICCLMNTIYTATNWLFMILMLVAVIMIVVGGFYYITAAGNPERAGTGGKIIVYALIGIAIALFAKVIPSIVKFIVGV